MLKKHIFILSAYFFPQSIQNFSWVYVCVCVFSPFVEWNVKIQNVSVHTFSFLFQLVEAVSTPGDISCLIGPVMKLLPSNNINVKRTAYSVLPRYIGLHDNELWIMAMKLFGRENFAIQFPHDICNEIFHRICILFTIISSNRNIM